MVDPNQMSEQTGCSGPSDGDIDNDITFFEQWEADKAANALRQLDEEAADYKPPAVDYGNPHRT
jgi:hypothetical protein